MDVVFIKPGSQRQLYGELSTFDLTAIEPPLWAALLAAKIRRQGYGVGLMDAEAENWSYEETAAQIRAANPRLAVVVVSGTNPSASTMNMTGAGHILRLLEENAPGIKRMIMGLHPSSLPERTLKEEHTDYLCQGEGFLTIPSLLDALKGSRTTRGIPGLWQRDGKEIVPSAYSPVCENLDSLPMPAWDLLPMKKYRAHNWHCFGHIEERQPYAVIYSSLGCPYRCSFCCINSMFGEKNQIRHRSPQRVVEEIDWLVETHGIRNIKLLDEMFALDERHVSDFCDRLIGRDYGLNLWAYARVNTVTQPMLAKMKRAGINWVAYGFESGNARVLKDVSKGYMLDQAMRVVEMTHAEGQHICANFIFGLPEDDYDSMQDTLNMAVTMNAAWANIYSAMAYPGSKLYEQALAEKLPLPETWQDYSQYAFKCRPLPTRYLSGGQVLAFRDYAFTAYHTNPRYLNMLEKTFGRDTRDYVSRMARRALDRAYAE